MSSRLRERSVPRHRKPQPVADAAEVVELFAHTGLTVAIAESLTGGLLCAALTEVPGASHVVRGGVTAYSTDAKHDVLGVPLAVLDNSGAVSAETAAAMADRVREMFGADIGVSTTGVAGPDIQEGKPVGMVFIGLVGPDAALVNEYSFSGTRAQIREQTLETAWGLLLEAVTQTD